jgi:hypothetical protein
MTTTATIDPTSIRRRTRAARAATLVLGAATFVAVMGAAGRAEAAAVKAVLKRQTLTVTGTTAADAITVRLRAGDPNTIEIDVGADGTAEFAFDRQKLTKIVVNGTGGADLITASTVNGAFTDTEATTLDGGGGGDLLLGANGPETLRGGSGNDFLDGNIGLDVVDGGDGTDTMQWDPGDSSDTIVGGPGADRFVFNGSAINEKLDLTNVGGHIRLTRDIAVVTLDIDDTETIDLHPQAGADTITIADLTGTDLTQLNSDLAGPGAVPDGVADQLIVNGTVGDDTVDIVAEGTDVVVEGLAAAVRISHTDPLLDILTVNGLEGTDTITATPEAGALLLLTLLP